MSAISADSRQKRSPQSYQSFGSATEPDLAGAPLGVLRTRAAQPNLKTNQSMLKITRKVKDG
jgi:hypothetical protein